VAVARQGTACGRLKLFKRKHKKGRKVKKKKKGGLQPSNDLGARWEKNQHAGGERWLWVNLSRGRANKSAQSSRKSRGRKGAQRSEVVSGSKKKSNSTGQTGEL